MADHANDVDMSGGGATSTNNGGGGTNTNPKRVATRSPGGSTGKGSPGKGGGGPAGKGRDSTRRPAQQQRQNNDGGAPAVVAPAPPRQSARRGLQDALSESDTTAHSAVQGSDENSRQPSPGTASDGGLAQAIQNWVRQSMAHTKNATHARTHTSSHPCTMHTTNRRAFALPARTRLCVYLTLSYTRITPVRAQPMGAQQVKPPPRNVLPAVEERSLGEVAHEFHNLGMISQPSQVSLPEHQHGTPRVCARELRYVL